MLLTTVWMLAADHHREWKPFQRKFRDVETWGIEAAHPADQNNAAIRAGAGRRKTPGRRPARGPAARTGRRVQADAGPMPPSSADAQRSDARAHRTRPDDELVARGRRQGCSTRLAERRRQLIVELEQFVADAQFRREQLPAAKRNSPRRLFDVDRSEYELGVGNELPASELEQIARARSKRPRPTSTTRTSSVEAGQDAAAWSWNACLGEIDGRRGRGRAKRSTTTWPRSTSWKKPSDDRADDAGQGNPRPADHRCLQPAAEDRADLAAEADDEQQLLATWPASIAAPLATRGSTRPAPGSAVEPAYPPQHTIA